MSGRSWMILSMLLILSAGSACDLFTGPANVSVDAVATNDCGPLDGPAVSIYLSSRPIASLEPPLPHIRIAVWQGPNALTERRWRLDAGDGGGWYYRNDNDHELATRGEVTVRSVASDTTIEGSVDVEFSDAGGFRGDFRAVWMSRAVLCG